jgi:hypothetical protein
MCENPWHVRVLECPLANCYYTTNKITKTNSVALVCKRIIPTERPPLVDEVSANFSG